MRDGFPVSVAELIAAGAWPLPGEAVAILLDVCEQVVRQAPGGTVLPAITTSALFLDGSGTVAVAGGVPVEDDQTVRLLGRLLLQMLPAPGSGAGARVPSRLRELAWRAASGELERVSVRRLAGSLRRFAPAQPKRSLRGLFERWRGGDVGSSSSSAPGAGLPDGARAVPVGATINAPLAGAVDARPARANARRRLVGALVAALLILASVGAAYWLSADGVHLPPVPLSPTLLSEPAAPPRGGWELLDPAGLAVEAGPLTPASEQVSAQKHVPPQTPDAAALRHPEQ